MLDRCYSVTIAVISASSDFNCDTFPTLKYLKFASLVEITVGERYLPYNALPSRQFGRFSKAEKRDLIKPGALPIHNLANTKTFETDLEIMRNRSRRNCVLTMKV